jgi:hypothetical protein
VLAGLWRHHETFDGTYTFKDLMDAHELLDTKEANEVIAREWQESQRNK